MAIEIKLKKEDGSIKKYSRPNTNVLEQEDFFKLQDDTRKAAIDEKKSRVEIQNMQIDFVVDLFKEHDAFTVNDLKKGLDSKDFGKTIKGIFAQISPEDYEEDPSNKKK